MKASLRSELLESIRVTLAEAQRQADATGREVVLVAVAPATEPSPFDRPWKADFLEHLRAGRAVRIAAELAGVSARHAYRCRSEDARFAAAWSAARICRGTSQRSHRAGGRVAS